MCDLNRIAALLLSATIAVTAAIVVMAAAAILATNWYTAPSNTFAMAAAAILVGLALSCVNGAMIETGKCQTGPCKALADRLFGALFALSATLGGLLTATIIAVFAASIPYAGVGVAIAIAVTAAAAGVCLILISAIYLPALDACRVTSAGAPPSTAVLLQRAVGVAAGVILIIFGAGAALEAVLAPPPVG
jgi:hypothetical protein